LQTSPPVGPPAAFRAWRDDRDAARALRPQRDRVGDHLQIDQLDYPGRAAGLRGCGMMAPARWLEMRFQPIDQQATKGISVRD